MTLSFKHRFRHSAGGREFVYLDIVQDATTSSFSAASIGMTYIDFAGVLKWSPGVSAAADVSALAYYLGATVTADGTKVDMVPMGAGNIKHVLLIGW